MGLLDELSQNKAKLGYFAILDVFFTTAVCITFIDFFTWSPLPPLLFWTIGNLVHILGIPIVLASTRRDHPSVLQVTNAVVWIQFVLDIIVISIRVLISFTTCASCLSNRFLIYTIVSLIISLVYILIDAQYVYTCSAIISLRTRWDDMDEMLGTKAEEGDAPPAKIQPSSPPPPLEANNPIKPKPTTTTKVTKQSQVYTDDSLDELIKLQQQVSSMYKSKSQSQSYYNTLDNKQK